MVVVAEVPHVTVAVPGEELPVCLVPVEVALRHGQGSDHDLSSLPLAELGPSVWVPDVGRAAGHHHSQAAGGDVEGPSDGANLRSEKNRIILCLSLSLSVTQYSINFF